MAEPNTYDLGDLVRVTGTFKNAAGAAIDPGTVAFKLRAPAGTVTSYVYGADSALVRDALGAFHVDVSAVASGTWHYRWESTGTGQAAEEGSFVVEGSALT